MVNLDVNGHTKTLNHRKIHRKTHKNYTDNLKNTRMEISAKWGPGFYFQLPGGRRRRFDPQPHRQLRHWVWDCECDQCAYV